MGLARLRKGDNVVVISGKDKGKKGKILRLDVEADKVIVEGVNMIKRHLRPNPKNPQGGILEKEAPIFASKVMPVDPKSGKGTRVRVGKDDKGNKIRVGTSGEEIVAPKAS
ncbi:MAG TPA: 50S ribosomal protein L24 [Polyangiaceae bacterium]|jgi:large subunit ribosomal protein L24